jgi:hypothetical protein
MPRAMWRLDPDFELKHSPEALEIDGAVQLLVLHRVKSRGRTTHSNVNDVPALVEVGVEVGNWAELTLGSRLRPAGLAERSTCGNVVRHKA